jgi:hypothetical protein
MTSLELGQDTHDELYKLTWANTNRKLSEEKSFLAWGITQEEYKSKVSIYHKGIEADEFGNHLWTKFW